MGKKLKGQNCGGRKSWLENRPKDDSAENNGGRH